MVENYLREVAERKNRSIIETAKSMIHDMNLPMCYSVEACNITMYILNMCSHRILKDMTPEEAFTGVKLDLSHLHMFVIQFLLMCLRRRGQSWNLPV